MFWKKKKKEPTYVETFYRERYSKYSDVELMGARNQPSFGDDSEEFLRLSIIMELLNKIKEQETLELDTKLTNLLA